MICPKCKKRMTKTEGGWSHVYDLSQYMKEGEELCTHFVKVDECVEKVKDMSYWLNEEARE